MYVHNYTNVCLWGNEVPHSDYQLGFEVTPMFAQAVLRLLVICITISDSIHSDWVMLSFALYMYIGVYRLVFTALGYVNGGDCIQLICRHGKGECLTVSSPSSGDPVLRDDMTL